MKACSPEDVGRAVRQARKRAGLTQRESAEEACCGVRFVSELENGKQTVELGKVIHVLNALSVDVELHARGEQR